MVYQFYSDVEKRNKMDEKPFFTFTVDALKPTDVKTLEKFAKSAFDIDKIVQEAGNLKVQSLIRKELQKEFAEPSDEFVSMLARRVHEGRITPAIKETFAKLLVAASIGTFIRDLVNERLSSALNASNPAEAAAADEEPETEEPGVVTIHRFYVPGYRKSQERGRGIVNRLVASEPLPTLEKREGACGCYRRK